MRHVAIAILFVLAGCSVDFLSTTPTNPGVPTAPAEVVALAGPDLVVLEGSRTVLAGDASRALVGAPELSWSQREGPLVTLSNPSAATPTFVAPLGPARLVFTLEVRADDVRDTDEVVVEVVTAAAALATAPRVVSLPADRQVVLDELVRIEAPWTGAGAPIVSARCPTLTGGPLGRLEGETLVIELAPRGLPCPIVVEDSLDEVGDGVGLQAAGRASLILWPADVPVAGTTRARAPATAGAGAPIVVDLDDGGRLFVVDGAPLALQRDGGRVSFLAPRRPGRLTLVAETRVGGSSGGVRVIAIEVGAGAGNSAPRVDGGPDLRVRPGARFRIAPVASDDDGDPVELTVRQVLGLEARQAGGGVGVLVAPDEVTPQTLLFHVSGSDGRAESDVDPVRVVVDPAAENLPPVITLAAELYVTPGSTFTIDSSGASDPDAGLITGWRIAQARTDTDNDADILLPDAVDTPTVTLTAGAAGARYRFVVSVTDDGGLEASAEVTVVVEEAGPYVDPIRAGATGDGTPARPFASVSDGLLTAARHRFPALHLVAGGPPLGLVPLPDGLGLEGGWRFDDDTDTYVQDGAPTVVRIADDELRLAGGSLGHLDVQSEREATVRLQRRVAVTAVGVAPQIATIVEAGARVVIVGSTLGRVENGGTLDLQQTTLRGPLRATHAVTGLGDDARVEADAADGAVVVTGGVLRTASTSAIVGGPVALRVDAGAIAAIAGRLEASGAGRAIGLHLVAGTVEFTDAIVVVGAPTATGLHCGAGTLGGRVDLAVTGDDAFGLDALAAPGATLGGTWTIEGRRSAVGARAPDLALERARLRVVGPEATGVRANTVALRAVLVRTVGDTAVDVVAGRGSLRHVSLLGSGRGVEAADVVTLDNSLCLAPGGLDGAVALGVVGFLEGVELGALGCVACVTGPAGAVLEDGALASDDALGGTNPFVDAGDLARAVSVDLAGVPVPQGAGPDLGALERAALEGNPP